MKKKRNESVTNRRQFIGMAGTSAMAMAMMPGIGFSGKDLVTAQVPNEVAKPWIPISDRKVKVGLVGYGYSKFGAAFGFQNHPNVEVVAVSDIIPERCSALAESVGCKKTYPSLEELVKDKSIEAVFVATDAPSHARHCIEVLKHGKHVASAVPAVFGSIDEAEQLLEVVKKNRGLNYMMFETSMFRANLYAMRKIYKAGGFGQLIYSEGEYYHGPSLSSPPPQANAAQAPYGSNSYKNWRPGLPVMWYPTHNNAYYIGVTDGTFVDVSCLGVQRKKDERHYDNAYNNPFKAEVALFRTDEGGVSRQILNWATPGANAEDGRVFGTRGCFTDEYKGYETNLPDLTRPALPPGVPEGGHGGSHGRLMQEFIYSIIEKRTPLVDIIMALNMTVPGIVAHQSALKDGETLKIPQYSL